MASHNRAKGTGTIYKRGKFYHFQYMVEGKLHRVSLKCTSKKEAEKKADELLPALNARTREEVATHVGIARKLITRREMNIDDVWEKFHPKRSMGTSPGTIKNYERQWNTFRAWLKVNYPKTKELKQITLDIAIEYAEKLEQEDKLSPSTFNQHRGTLSLITKTLSKQADIFENVWLEVPRMINEGISRKELSEKEILKLLGIFDDDEFSIPSQDEMRVLFNIGTWTGLRLIDCVMLKWDSINLERGFISCTPRKTKRYKTVISVPLHPWLKNELNNALQWQENEYVLPKVAEKYKNKPNGVKKDVMRVFRACGFKTNIQVEDRKQKTNIIGFHSLRHSFVSFCAKAGVPLPVVQAIVGHGNPAITRHYIHIGEESVKQAINALPQGNLLPESKKEKTDSQKIAKIRNLLKKEKSNSILKRQIVEILC
jgi:integrase